MKQHDYAAEGKSISIECVANGFLVIYEGNDHEDHTEIFKTFESAIDFVACHFYLKAVLPELRLIEETK